MQTTHQRRTPCPVYLHPTACSSRASVEHLQLRTGRLVISNPSGRTAAIKPVFIADASEAASGPIGDDAA
jgi:hypothetical protein